MGACFAHWTAASPWGFPRFLAGVVLFLYLPGKVFVDLALKRLHALEDLGLSLVLAASVLIGLSIPSTIGFFAVKVTKEKLEWKIDPSELAVMNFFDGACRNGEVVLSPPNFKGWKGTELSLVSALTRCRTPYNNHISGLVGTESSFHSPCGKKREYTHTMRGPSLERPLFLFRYDGKRLFQLFYCLAWGTPHDPEAWTIYSLETAPARLVPLKSGRGKDVYGLAMEELAKIGITPRDIMWGAS